MSFARRKEGSARYRYSYVVYYTMDEKRASFLIYGDFGTVFRWCLVVTSSVILSISYGLASIVFA